MTCARPSTATLDYLQHISLTTLQDREIRPLEYQLAEEILADIRLVRSGEGETSAVMIAAWNRLSISADTVASPL